MISIELTTNDLAGIIAASTTAIFIIALVVAAGSDHGN